jgi:hypothetical protein
MLSGEFERKLRSLNKNLRIFCGDDNSKPAGIFTIEKGEYKSICGIDKNYVPEYPEYAENGAIVRSGFRRVVKLLIKQGYIDRKDAESKFRLHFEYPSPRFKYKSPSVREKVQRMGLSVMEENSGNN